MSNEIDIKLESIMISVVNKLFEKEANVGLDYEDLKALEIINKIYKDSNPVERYTADTKAETDPSILLELVKRARTFKSNDTDS